MRHRTISHLIPLNVKRTSAVHVHASRKMDKYLSQHATFKLPKNGYISLNKLDINFLKSKFGMGWWLKKFEKYFQKNL